MARQVHKFGGSSLADAEHYFRVADIISDFSQPGDLVVVSAAGNTTQQLLTCLTLSGKATVDSQWRALAEFQQRLYEQTLLVPQPALAELKRELEVLREQLRQPVAEQQKAAILGLGECWSARLLAALLNERQLAARWLDARDFMQAEAGPQPAVLMAPSKATLQPLLAEYGELRTVITGYIARDPDQQPSTLGRNGSDYSAAAIAVLADAESLTIWTDVPGIFSADPRYIEHAVPWPELTQTEAQWLAHLGSPVLHARTLEPLADQPLLLTIRSSEDVQAPGTVIRATASAGQQQTERLVVTGLGAVSRIRLRCPADVPAFMEQLRAGQFLPLSYHADDQYLQLCFTHEVADSAWQWLTTYDSTLRPRRDNQCALVAVVTQAPVDSDWLAHWHSYLPEHGIYWQQILADRQGVLAVVDNGIDIWPLQKRLHQHWVENDPG